MKKFLSMLYTVILLTTVYATTFVVTQPTKEMSFPEPIKATGKKPKEIDYSLLYTYKPDAHLDTCLTVSIVDAQTVMKIARQEGGPTLDGQLWAMRVIFNRLDNGNFGGSIWEIVSAEGQFDVFTDGSYQNAEVNENTHIALAMIEGGWDETEGSLYWRMEKGHKGSWHDRNLTYVKTVDGNRYYK